MTQHELAQRSGVRQSNIAAYESGSRVPSTTMVDRLVTAASPRPSTVLRRLRAQVLEAAGHAKASNVRVFGSVARGQDTPDSDVDILVTFAPDATLRDQARLIIDLEQLLGSSVDVVSDVALGRHHESVLSEAKAV